MVFISHFNFFWDAFCYIHSNFIADSYHHTISNGDSLGFEHADGDADEHGRCDSNPEQFVDRHFLSLVFSDALGNIHRLVNEDSNDNSLVDGDLFSFAHADGDADEHGRCDSNPEQLVDQHFL